MNQLVPERRLPVLAGAENLRFKCNGCGACCRQLRVAITHHDLLRLSRGLGRPAASLVDWLSPAAVDMTGEPESFVELGSGRHLMVLAQEAGACRLLDAADRCTAYEHRPYDCQMFPFDLSHDERGLPIRVSLLPLEGCSEQRGDAADITELAARDQRRWDELRDYQRVVERWNRLARHRRRFRRPIGDAAAFLSWLGLGEEQPLERRPG